MPTSYTSLLGLALPVTGELSGTWGDTVNDYITRYVDASVAGTQAISGSQTAVTLTVTNGTTLTQVGSGSSGSAQYAVINCTGNPAGLLTITAPASSRQYLIINATSTSQSVKIVGAGPTTGVTLVTGESAIVAWNGSDYVKVASSTADGVTTFSAGTTGFTPSTATSGAVTLAGTLATTNGGTGLTSFTANRVFYSSSTSAIGSSANLTFDGTTLTVNNLTDSSLTSGRVTYAGTGGNLVDSANLVFDGSNLGIGASSPATKLDVNGDITQRNGSGVTVGKIENATGWYSLTGDSTNVNGAQMSHSTTLRFVTASTERMRLDASGNLGLGVTPSAWNSSQWSVFEGAYGGALAFYKASNVPVTVLTSNAYNDGSWKYKTTDPALQYEMDGNAGIHKWYTAPSGTAGNAITFTQELQITAAGFTQPTAYADTVVALGNSGTATTIDLQTANVFTATLTGNCTFTLSNPIATGSSSFTLILTNDGTAGRTVAWSGGSFRFPGGAASLSRTTTANAVDIWVFFTPDGGTTWYGNIAMKNMTA